MKDFSLNIRFLAQFCSRMIFASFHQGKEEIVIRLFFVIPESFHRESTHIECLYDSQVPALPSQYFHIRAVTHRPLSPGLAKHPPTPPRESPARSGFPPCPGRQTCPKPGKNWPPAAYYFNYRSQPAHILGRAIFQPVLSADGVFSVRLCTAGFYKKFTEAPAGRAFRRGEARIYLLPSSLVSGNRSP